MSDKYWFIHKNGMRGPFWDFFRWGILAFMVLPATILQVVAVASGCSATDWGFVAIVTFWDIPLAVAMLHASNLVLDVQIDADGLEVTSILGRRARLNWSQIGRVRLALPTSRGPVLVIHKTRGKSQERICFNIAHPGTGVDAERFILSRVAALAPSRLMVEQLPASWRDIGAFNAWFLGSSLLGLAIATLMGRYHLEAAALFPLPSAILLSLAVRLRQNSSIEVERGVLPQSDKVPRTCRAWVKALASRTNNGGRPGDSNAESARQPESDLMGATK